MNYESHQAPQVREDDRGVRRRQVMRALPSGMELGFIVLAIVAVVQDSKPLLAAAIAGEIGHYLDPECTDPEHEHDDCPACADLPPLVSARALLRRFRKATTR